MLNGKRSTDAKLRLLRLAAELKNVSEACRVTGFSRDSYYRLKRLYDNDGERALIASPRRWPVVRNNVAPGTEQAVLELARTNSRYGRLMVSKLLRKQGFAISPAGVRLVWLSRGLETAVKRAAWTVESGHIGNTETKKSTSPAGILENSKVTCGGQATLWTVR